MIDYLSLEDLLEIVDIANLQAVRDIGLLDSAAHRPQTSLFGDDAYLTLHEKAAVLLESVVRNQALIDGNRRLGWLAITVFFRRNGEAFHVDHDEADELVIVVATGTMSYQDSAARLAAWTSTST